MTKKNQNPTFFTIYGKNNTNPRPLTPRDDLISFSYKYSRIFRKYHTLIFSDEMSSSSEETTEEGVTSAEHGSNRSEGDDEQAEENVLDLSSDEETNQKSTKKHKTKQKSTNKYIDIAGHNAKLKHKKKIKHDKKITCRTVPNSDKPYNKNEQNSLAERTSIVKRTVTFPKHTIRGQVLLKQEGMNLRILDVYNSQCEVISKSAKELIIASEL